MMTAASRVPRSTALPCRRCLADIRARKIDIVVVYKVDRLTRALGDFAKLVEVFDEHSVSFVSVTQSFNTTSSMGRLTLNMLLSFAQFEREVIGERVRDKIAASKKKGIWVGGSVPLGYASVDKKVVIVPEDAEKVRTIFRRYLEVGSITGSGPGSGTPRHPHPAPDPLKRQDPRGHPIRSWSAPSTAEEPVSHRRRRLSRRGLSRRTLTQSSTGPSSTPSKPSSPLKLSRGKTGSEDRPPS